MRKVALSALGVGFLPGPTGTYASAVTAALAWAAPTVGVPALAAAVALAALGTTVTLALARGLPTADGSAADPSWVVTDEVAGQGLALALAWAAGGPLLAPGVAAFLGFRVLDVTKPGPVGAAERLPGATGILADDLVAGAGAGALVLCLRLVGAFSGLDPTL